MPLIPSSLFTNYYMLFAFFKYDKVFENRCNIMLHCSLYFYLYFTIYYNDYALLLLELQFTFTWFQCSARIYTFRTFTRYWAMFILQYIFIMPVKAPFSLDKIGTSPMGVLAHCNKKYINKK